MLEEVYVVDAGVLFTNWTARHPDALLVTTDEVLNEIINRPSRQRIEFLLSTDRLRVEAYDPTAFQKVRHASSKTGDRHVLSDVDVSIIALALTRSENDLPTVLVSTDLALLNTAIALGIKVVDPTGRLKHHITWKYRCPSCGHVSERPPPDLICPTCGNSMRRQPRRRKRIT